MGKIPFARPAGLGLMLCVTLACGANGGTGPDAGGGPPDTTAPIVLATSPARLDSLAALNGVVTVAFSEPMAPSTLSAATFSVSRNGAPVPGSVAYANAAATFIPDAILSGGVTYTARVTTGATDTAGNALASDYVWTFSTPSPEVAYVTNKNDATVSLYWVDGANGRLYPRGHVDVQYGSNPIAVTVNPSKQFAFVANYGSETNSASGSVTTFRINATVGDEHLGELTEIGTVGGVVSWPQSLAVDPSGSFVYVANFGAKVLTEFGVRPTGDLQYIGLAPTGTQPLSIAVGVVGVGSAAKGYVYSANFSSGGVTTLTIDQTSGGLTPVGAEVDAGIAPRSVAVDPQGRYVYVANRGTPDKPESHSVAMFRINQNTGALTATPLKTKVLQETGSAPERVTVDPSGRFVYVADPGGRSVALFPIDQTTGELGDETAISVGDQPVTVAVDPTGRFAYVVDFSSDQVTVFSIDQPTGVLTPIGDAVDTGDQPYGMTVVAF